MAVLTIELNCPIHFTPPITGHRASAPADMSADAASSPGVTKTT